MDSLRKIQDPKELFILKQKAAKYYQENAVPSKMEEILNTMFFDDPDDVFGHLTNYFEKFAKPAVISKIRAREVFDSRGQPAIETDLFCTIKNNEKLVNRNIVGNECYLMDNVPATEKDSDDSARYSSIVAALQLLMGDVQDKVKGLSPLNQDEIDGIALNVIEELRIKDQEEKAAENAEVAQESQSAVPPAASPSAGKKSAKGKKGPPVVIIPDEPREKLFPGCTAVCAISQAVCNAAAIVSDIPLYQHIYNLKFKETLAESIKLPLPMVTIMQSGKAAPGKQNCVKEFMVIPKPDMPVKESIKNISNIYQTVLKTLYTKLGVTIKNVSESGAICPQFDRPEQGLDAIQEAITTLGFTPGEDFHIAINAAGHEMFDSEKGKYEVVTGMQKLPDDMPDFWAELLGRYQSIIALIDPIRKEDKVQWMAICERLSERCYIISDNKCPRPGLLKDNEPVDDFKTSAVVMKMEQITSVSDIINASKTMEYKENQVIISSSVGDSSDSFITDLAVGIQSRFLKTGSPCRGERVAKLNRLLQIGEQLEEQNKLVKWDEHIFPKLSLPPPPETPEGEADANAEQDAKKK
ncbi:enolase 4-like [Tubulanus polymorphus]|uniref:enolase 4-like n=1 Tax=Tubulanus polymorphus TaxID=672921 RepID=UPI003DA26810